MADECGCFSPVACVLLFANLMRITSSLPILALPFLVLSAAHADVVTIQGGGTHIYYDGVAIQRVPFSVSFSYDTNAPVLNSVPDQAFYSALSFTLTINLIEGTWTDTTSGAQIAVFNGQYQDQFQITSETDVDAPFYRGSEVWAYKVELSGTQSIFSSTALPSTLSLADWAGGKAVVYNPSYATLVNSNLSTLSAIPEPSSMAMLAGAAVLGGVVFRRRSRKA